MDTIEVIRLIANGMMFEMCRGSGQKMPESSGHAKDKEGP